MWNRRGVTLLEVLLSIAILGILGAGTTSAILRFHGKSDLDFAVTMGASSLRRAEELSRAVSSDQTWGVKFATGTITVFRGASYALRDSSVDEATAIGPDIYASGADEYVFTKVYATTTAATTTLVHNVLGESRMIMVNAKGTIDY